jgi:hypothetical protein
VTVTPDTRSDAEAAAAEILGSLLRAHGPKLPAGAVADAAADVVEAVLEALEVEVG